MSIKGQMSKFSDLRPRLLVIGVGGAGCNAVNNMIASGLEGVEFVVANTDAQALASSAAESRLQLGANLTEGLGAGSRPEIGEAAAEEAIDEIRKQVAGAHMVFIAAGMGGGTGTGAAAVIARIAKESGALTVGVVTKPFLFEGARRMRIAEMGVEELRQNVDTLIVIPNQNLFRIASEKTTFSEAFVMADQVLYSGVACIVDLILKEGLINLDFADVRTVMTGMGSAMMGTGEATGDRRATLAAEEAISNPLLDDVSLRGAKGLLLSITGGANLTLYEVDEAASRVRQEVDPEANIIVGATYDASLGDRVRVSIVASGMARMGEHERMPPAPAEDWVRGQRQQGAAHGSAVPPPPPQRPSFIPGPSYAGPQPAGNPHAGRGAQPPRAPDPMQRRLSEALQYAPGAQAGLQPQRASGMPPREGSGPRSPWRGPGNVTVEDAPPQLGASHLPPPLPTSYDADAAQAAFNPQAPNEARRPRRMPDLSEFPPVAQRAYQAAEQQARGEAPRKPGLFERLTGRVRGESDSRPHAQHSEPTYQQPQQASRQHAADGSGYPQEEGMQPHPNDHAHDTDMPMFFNRRR